VAESVRYVSRTAPSFPTAAIQLPRLRNQKNRPTAIRMATKPSS
jgi:hypothetical protein